MKNKINQLEQDSKTLEIKGEELNELAKQVLKYSQAYVNQLDEQNTYSSEGYDSSELDTFLEPENKKGNISSILEYLEKRVDNGGINPASGGHLGYIPGGGLYAAALGDLLAATSNKYAAVFYASPGACRLEDSLVKWAGKLMGYESGFGGFLSSGGSMANLSAIHTAREAKGIRSKDLSQSVIYLSQQSHHSILKAIKICGLSECPVRLISLRDDFTLCPDHLKKCIIEDQEMGLKPFLLVANAGSTDLGAVDDLGELSNIAKANNIWFHVDAAYGGFFMLTEEGKEKLNGIQHADSIILDPHKGLFLPFGTGICLVKNRRAMVDAHQYRANYMQDVFDSETVSSSADLSPELSKHFRGLRMWLPLKLHGINAFRAALEEKLALAKYLEAGLKQLGVKVYCSTTLSVVAFQLRTGVENNKLNKQLMEYILKDGRLFISSTNLNDETVLRAAILSFRTHQKEIDLLLDLVQQFLRKNQIVLNN